MPLGCTPISLWNTVTGRMPGDFSRSGNTSASKIPASPGSRVLDSLCAVKANPERKKSNSSFLFRINLPPASFGLRPHFAGGRLPTPFYLSPTPNIVVA